jgi:hypothetical protein
MDGFHEHFGMEGTTYYIKGVFIKLDYEILNLLI